jgi:hypothetical protein
MPMSCPSSSPGSEVAVTGKRELEAAAGSRAVIRAAPSAIARLSRAVFSFPVMLAFALALLTFSICRGRFNDVDTWLHLKIGQTIWNTRSVPRTDVFSYTANGHVWVAHEWLAQVLIYSAYRLGGYRGMMLWLSGLASLLFVLLYVYCSLYSGNPKVSLLGGLMGLFFGTVGLAIRPLLLGYLFLIVELLLIHLGRTHSRRWLCGLPALFLIWANCHGSYSLGLLVLGLFLGCSFLRLQAGLIVSDAWPRPARAALCVIFPACLLAPLVNPIGLRLVAYPLNLFTRQIDSLANIMEWSPLNVGDPRGAGTVAVLGVLFLIVVLRRPAVHLDEALLLVLGTAMALRHIRMVFIFGIFAAPVLCRLLAEAWERYDPERDHRRANAVLISASIALMILVFPARDQLEEQVRASNPAGAVQFIWRARLSGPMLNDEWWGGFLMWALPEQKVFIDSRADVFDWAGVLGEYVRWSTLKQDPKLLLDKYGVQYCLLQKDAPISIAMRYLPGWRQAYADDLSVIFVRTDEGRN